MTTQPEALLEAKLIAQLRGQVYGNVALDAKVAGVAQAVAAAQKWKKRLLQQMFV
jgi:hypothetical protein